MTIFLPKINRVFLSSILQNLNGMSVQLHVGQFFGNDCPDEWKRMLSRKTFSILEDGQNDKIVIKI